MQKKNMLLIDGSSFIFRAFYALPHLKTSYGFPTGAIRGTFNMINNLQKKYNFQHCVCVFDSKGKTCRHEIFPDYKANRRSVPEELSLQFDSIYSIIKAMGIPVISKLGIEADDIIGTIALNSKKKDFKVIIATGDKDFAQLVDEDIVIINTMLDEMLDIEGVNKKFGVYPSQIVDYLTLVGDKADNIPGVYGCGEKTASKWLKEFKNIENLLTNVEQLKGVIAENLKKSLDWIHLSKQLVTINTKIKLDELDLNDTDNFICSPQNNKQLVDYFKKFEFNSLLSKLDNVNIHQEDLLTDTKEYEYVKIIDLNHFKDFISYVQELKETISIVFILNEYIRIDSFKILAIGIKDQVFIFEEIDLIMISDYDNLIDQLKRLLLSDNPKILLNFKETLKILDRFNLDISNVVGDLILSHYIKNSKFNHSLSSIYNEYLNLTIIDIPDLFTYNKNSQWVKSNKNQIIQNTLIIIQNIIKIEKLITDSLTSNELKIYRELELPLSRVLFDIEKTGFKINKIEFKELQIELELLLKSIEDKIFGLTKFLFNINSPKQLQSVLFDDLKLPTASIKKNKNGFSTDEDSLLILKNQGFLIAEYLLEYRNLNKLLNTYITKIPLLADSDSRVHTTFEQTVVASGRLSSKDPNLQNIPIKNALSRRIRQCFIAKSGHKLVALDYSQIELRILAHYSKDQNLIQAFNNGLDIHLLTASSIFSKEISEISDQERQFAKMINFSIIYGKTVFGLSQELSIDRTTAKKYIDSYFANYPKIQLYFDNIKDSAHSNKFVETILGRRVYLDSIDSKNRFIREMEERVAINSPMQGTSADIIKVAMVNIYEYLNKNNFKTKIVLQVHDELIFESPNEEVELILPEIINIMENSIKLIVQMKVNFKIGENWSEI